jgi:hypothetical protein
MIGKRRCEERWLAIVFAAIALGPPAFGQEPGSVTIDVGSCVNLEKPGERLDCFERQLEAQGQTAPEASRTGQTPATPARTAPSPAATPAPAREAAPTATATPDAVESIRERRTRREEAAAPGREITAVVTDLRESIPNTWTVTLDNGQVWRQSPPKPYPLRVGAQVRLYPTGWGTSYRLTVDEQRGFIQVERVR